MTSTPPPADSAVRPMGPHLLPGGTVGAITVLALEESVYVHPGAGWGGPCWRP